MHETTYSEDGLHLYLADIADHHILSREEEVEVFQRIEAGDEAARDHVVTCNLRLVVKIALQFKDCGVPLSDLIQEGNVGLLYVTRKFDWRKGFRFSTYAAFWIRQEIQAAIRTNSSFIRLPIRKARLMGRIAETARHFQKMEGRDPSSEEIAVFLGEPLDKIEMLISLREPVVSLDQEHGDDNCTLAQSLAHDGPAPYIRLDEEQKCIAVRGVLQYLSERERHIIELRFGLGGERPLSLRKTSTRVGLSQEGVRRIERRALGKLQRPAIRSRLEGIAA